MLTTPDIQRRTVKSLKDQGYTFYFMIPVKKEKETLTSEVPVLISAVQLTAAVMFANRKDEVLVKLYKGRNGKKTARIIEIPYC